MSFSCKYYTAKMWAVTHKAQKTFELLPVKSCIYDLIEFYKVNGSLLLFKDESKEQNGQEAMAPSLSAGISI